MNWDKNKVRVNEETRWEEISCPVCNGGSFVELFKKLDEPFVKCVNCELVLINPRPVYAQVLDTYDNDYSLTYANKAEKKMRRVRRWVNRVKKGYVQQGRWLDVGCSVGFVVRAAEEAGFEGHGVDVQSWGIDYGSNVLKLNRLRCGKLEEQVYPDNYFDVISLYDVIEHVPDLNRTVTELNRILNQDGIIDIITPDINHWRVPKPLSEWKEIKPSEHLYYFNNKTLTRLLDKHGLKIIKQRIAFKSMLKVYVAHTGN
jgi:2-polyprenyl-3-methyl-5-hydroxy-6-metoxy-1,4-benzoquinol methylase